MKDPYEVLGVERNASKDAIRVAYKNLVKRYHPDKFQSNPDMLKLAEEKMKEINEAYNYLMNHAEDEFSYSDDDASIYAQTRQKIQNGELYEAEDLLVKISDKTNPDWYFLNGIIYAQRGWYEKARDYIKRAYEMRPNNQEYEQAYRTVERTSRSYGPVYTGGGQMNEGSACLSCCATLACADLCCNCMGGGC